MAKLMVVYYGCPGCPVGHCLSLSPCGTFHSQRRDCRLCFCADIICLRWKDGNPSIKGMCFTRLIKGLSVFEVAFTTARPFLQDMNFWSRKDDTALEAWDLNSAKMLIPMMTTSNMCKDWQEFLSTPTSFWQVATTDNLLGWTIQCLSLCLLLILF